MTLTPHEKEIKALKKQVRILQKKLDYSEADRLRLEEGNNLREKFLKSLISKLESSENSLTQRSQELEETLKNIQALQSKLVESEKISALGVLVAGIAHEINNPISFIYGNISYAMEYFQDLLKLISLYERHYPEPHLEIAQKRQDIDLDFLQEDLSSVLESMDFGAERIKNIILSLRTFARLGESSLKAVDIHTGIDSSLMMLNNRLQTGKVPIKITSDYGDLPNIECFAGQLNQAFLNILTNSIDAIEESVDKKTDENVSELKEIVITTQVIGDESIGIIITDNGVGMSEEVQAHLFDPFFTTKPVGKGTGLGLAIAHQIITAQHQGLIHCTSTEGQGTTITISLPVSINTQLTHSL
ncbi:histidine kinase [[Leptolyngbya] sp. PCC 7376]|uniref:sensor histidine kinase n=1 Tax=[Leptolyngbya] sp. PCC 7376 TaxID=111781 RepID=UPI00029EE5FF|nr:ATP-binding protein [[Leptolyngbya] sp. PCC 7376]AFY40185.1 histidine kinase [[Leptolyngbya] sp. PCC 7376]